MAGAGGLRFAKMGAATTSVTAPCWASTSIFSGLSAIVTTFEAFFLTTCGALLFDDA